MATTDNFSNYLRDRFNDLLFGAVAYTRPSTTEFVALTAMSTAAGGGTPAAGYAPKSVTNNATNWPASVSRLKTSANDIDFGNNSAGTDTIVGLSEYDLGSPQNLLTFEELNSPILVNNGDNFLIAAGLAVYSFQGSLAVTFDPLTVSIYSDYMSDKANDHLHGGPDFTPPATLYLELVTAMGATDGSGGTAAPGFARLAVTNNLTSWPASSGQTKTNGIALNFGTNGAGSATIVGLRIWDASTSGNLLTLNTLSTPTVVAASAPFIIPVGAQVFGWHA